MKIDKSTKKGKIYWRFIYSMLVLSSFSLSVCWFLDVWNKVPSCINVRAGQEEGLQFYVPATATIYNSKYERELNVNLARKLKIYGETEDTYTMEVELFGFIPFKESSVSVIQDIELIPAGEPVGIYVRTDGVLVIDTGEFYSMEGTKEHPAKGVLKVGDYIHKINGMEVKNKEDLMDKIANSSGNDIVLEVKRNNELIQLNIKPKRNETGQYKLGIWVRDNAQGIGTLTFIDKEGNFGALGHGINDIDTANLIELKSGGLYKTDIISIRKGEGGNPGELTGVIAYAEQYRIGSIYANSKQGIYGKIDSDSRKKEGETLPIALKQEIEKGPASIICTVAGVPTYYDVEILQIHQENDNVNRGLELKVVDEELLEITGGIVQGMSGSPIIQDGKLIGAVTHVLVNDPTRGYGIFIENMLEAAS